MAALTFEITENGRQQIAKFQTFLHWISVFFALLCIITAVYVQLAVDDKVEFIDYGGVSLTSFLHIIGLAGIFVHGFCGLVYFRNRQVDGREKWCRYLYCVLVLSLLLCITDFIAGVVVLVYIRDLDNSFDEGIRRAMTEYQGDAETKMLVDMLQMSYRCCGSRSYTDWFDVKWVHPDFVDPNPKTGTSIEDVPFSCCNASILRPCIRTHVHSNTQHYNYDYRIESTLNRDGCTGVLVENFENSLFGAMGYILLVVSIIQLGSCVAGRLLQTAIYGTKDKSNSTDPTTAFLFMPPSSGSPPAPANPNSDTAPLLSTAAVQISTAQKTKDTGKHKKQTKKEEKPAAADKASNAHAYHPRSRPPSQSPTYSVHTGASRVRSPSNMPHVVLSPKPSPDAVYYDMPMQMDYCNSSAPAGQNWPRHYTSRTDTSDTDCSTGKHRTPSPRPSPLVINMSQDNVMSTTRKPIVPNVSANSHSSSSMHCQLGSSPSIHGQLGNTSSASIHGQLGNTSSASIHGQLGNTSSASIHGQLGNTSSASIHGQLGNTSSASIHCQVGSSPSKHCQKANEVVSDRRSRCRQAPAVMAGARMLPGGSPKKSPNKRNRSPKKAISPQKTSFRSGVSYKCNHALE